MNFPDLYCKKFVIFNFRIKVRIYFLKDKTRRMPRTPLSINIKIIQDVESETIHVPTHYYYSIDGYDYQIQHLQKAVTEKYGIPEKHLKFQTEDGDTLTLSSDAYSSELIKVIVDKDFDTDKPLKAGTRVFIEDMTQLMEDPETADFTLATRVSRSTRPFSGPGPGSSGPCSSPG